MPKKPLTFISKKKGEERWRLGKAVLIRAETDLGIAWSQERMFLGVNGSFLLHAALCRNLEKRRTNALKDKP